MANETGFWRQAHALMAMSIDQNKSIPKEAKEDLKKLVDMQMRAISQTIGTYELLYLREKQEK